MLSRVCRVLEQEYHHLSLWYFVSFVFGIAFFFQNHLDFSFCFLAVATVITAFIVFVSYDRNLLALFLSFCLLAFIIGISISQLRMSMIHTNPIDKARTAVLTGRVEQIKPSARGMQLTLQNVAVENYRSLNKVRINIASKLLADVNYGDLVRLKAKIFPLQTSVLPGTYDFGFYMYMSGIEANGYALTNIEILAKEQGAWRQFMQKIRLNIYNRLIDILGDDRGNFAAAILIGETKAIPKQIAENMRNSGVAHILSVSGLHLSLVAMIFFISSRMLLNCSNFFAYKTNVKTIAACISIIGSFFYLQISGNNIAATRAFIMTSIFIVSIILGRSPYPLRSVMIAAFIILTFLPEYVLHPSFQLSFTAVLCLISGYEFYLKHQKFLGNRKGVIGTLKLYIFANIYSSFLASIITAPFVIYHFYKFANYAVMMNLVAVPLMSFVIMPLALLAIILMPFSIDGFFIKILGFFIGLVIDSADYIANLPGAIWVTGHISPVSLFIFSFGFFWICLWKTKLRFVGMAIMLASLVIMVLGEKPDFIYDHNLKAVGVRDESGKLEIYAEEEPPVFISDYWASWYGQKEIKVIREKITRADQDFILPNGRMLALNYWQCLDADVQLITSKKLHCSADNGIIISNKELQYYRQVLVYCSKTKGCKAEYFVPDHYSTH
jgi:ComEC/Rec2-related protein